MTITDNFLRTKKKSDFQTLFFYKTLTNFCKFDQNIFFFSTFNSKQVLDSDRAERKVSLAMVALNSTLRVVSIKYCSMCNNSFSYFAFSMM